MGKNNVVLVDFEDTILVPAPKVIGWAEAILNELQVKEKEISFYFCTASTIASLNSQYRGKEGATDVLSFSQLEGENEGVDIAVLGDVVICNEVASQQAAEYKVSIEKEVLRLIIHGVLHLLGYDHENSEAEADLMQEKEQYLMNKLGDDN